MGRISNKPKTPGTRQESAPKDGNVLSRPGGLPAGYPENLESILQATIRALPRSDGGFTIEVRPLDWAQGPTGGKRQKGVDRPARGGGASRVTLETPGGDSLSLANSPGDNWRPKGRAVLSLAEVARTLSLSRTTVWRLIQNGKLDTTPAGSRVLVLIESVDAFLAAGHGGKQCA